MDIRITGTKQECYQIAEDFKTFYDIISISDFYPNTRKCKESKEGRVYVKMNMTYLDEKGNLRKI